MSLEGAHGEPELDLQREDIFPRTSPWPEVDHGDLRRPHAGPGDRRRPEIDP